MLGLSCFQYHKITTAGRFELSVALKQVMRSNFLLKQTQQKQSICNIFLYIQNSGNWTETSCIYHHIDVENTNYFNRSERLTKIHFTEIKNRN